MFSEWIPRKRVIQEILCPKPTASDEGGVELRVRTAQRKNSERPTERERRRAGSGLAAKKRKIRKKDRASELCLHRFKAGTGREKFFLLCALCEPLCENVPLPVRTESGHDFLQKGTKRERGWADTAHTTELHPGFCSVVRIGRFGAEGMSTGREVHSR